MPYFQQYGGMPLVIGVTIRVVQLRSQPNVLWLLLTAVTITSGDRAHSNGEHWHVPKRDLLTCLLVLLEAGELKIPRGLNEVATLVRELSEVEVRHRPGGVVRMGSDGPGEHDDLVIAVALACWRGKRRQNAHGTQRLPGI